jgi:hypothetical protein
MHLPSLSAKDTQMWFNKPPYSSYEELDGEEQEYKNSLAEIHDFCSTRDLLGIWVVSINY